MSLLALYEIFFIVSLFHCFIDGFDESQHLVSVHLSVWGMKHNVGTTSEPQGNHVGKLEGPSILMGTTWVIPEGSR